MSIATAKPAVQFKAHSYLASTSAFAFSKIIEAIVTKCKCKEWVLSILCINVNITIGTMQTFDTHVDANVNIDDQFERTFIARV